MPSPSQDIDSTKRLLDLRVYLVHNFILFVSTSIRGRSNEGKYLILLLAQNKQETDALVKKNIMKIRKHLLQDDFS
jgi:hypothetical protein